jgi:hypothetical protein
MKQVTVAIDVDGTLLLPNEDIRALVRIFHSFRNVRARQAARLAHVEHWTHQYASKTEDLKPDIVIDDRVGTSLGIFNLILDGE